MNNNKLINKIESEYIQTKNIKIKVGDTVNLGLKISEGDKTRIQFYQGVTIAKKNSGINETITIRKIFQGIGIERCFLINSKKIESVKILKSSRVRRSKLYYLRKLSGKATRLKEQFK